MVRQLGLIIKATRMCNLRCSYCHDWRAREPTMPFEVLARLTHASLTSGPYDAVEFIWHGGEPLLLGQAFFMKAIYLQDQYRHKRQTLNSIQTNGTLLSDSWVQFFKEAGFRVGLSIDGPATIHNRHRVNINGRGTHAEVMRAMDLLRKHNVPFGVLMVLGHESIRLGPERIYNFFKEAGIESWDYLPARPSNNGEIGGDYVTEDEYSEFMCSIFDLWYEDADDLKICELHAILNSVVGGTVHLCTLAGNCLGKYFHVEADGSLYHCDKYVGDSEYKPGNILVDDFNAIDRSLGLARLREAEAHQHRALRSCEYYHICNGGCPHDRYLAQRYQSGNSGECCGKHTLIEHVKAAVERDGKRLREKLIDVDETGVTI